MGRFQSSCFPHYVLGYLRNRCVLWDEFLIFLHAFLIDMTLMTGFSQDWNLKSLFYHHRRRRGTVWKHELLYQDARWASCFPYSYVLTLFASNVGAEAAFYFGRCRVWSSGFKPGARVPPRGHQIAHRVPIVQFRFCVCWILFWRKLISQQFASPHAAAGVK